MSLSACGVSLRRGGAWALTNASLDVTPGRLTALVGPNGAGKSTILRVLAGELKPDAGCARLNGAPLTRFGVKELSRVRAVMQQSASMAFDFLVEEVLAMGWVGADDGRAAAVGAAVRECGLNHLLGRRFNTLSGGERQRVQFARALVQISHRDGAAAAADARYLLLDEPTASLDLTHESLVLRLARRAAQRNVGVLAVLHDLNLAARFADRVTLLAGGAVVAAGAPDAVFTDAALSGAYGAAIRVERHAQLQRLVVHALDEDSNEGRPPCSLQ